MPAEFQQPFEVTHESMRALQLHRDQPVHRLAANLRRAFSGIVTGNVKETASARSSAWARTSSPAIRNHAAAR